MGAEQVRDCCKLESEGRGYLEHTMEQMNFFPAPTTPPSRSTEPSPTSPEKKTSPATKSWKPSSLDLSTGSCLSEAGRRQSAAGANLFDDPFPQKDQREFRIWIHFRCLSHFTTALNLARRDLPHQVSQIPFQPNHQCVAHFHHLTRRPGDPWRQSRPYTSCPLA